MTVPLKRIICQICYEPIMCHDGFKTVCCRSGHIDCVDLNPCFGKCGEVTTSQLISEFLLLIDAGATSKNNIKALLQKVSVELGNNYDFKQQEKERARLQKELQASTARITSLEETISKQKKELAALPPSIKEKQGDAELQKKLLAATARISTLEKTVMNQRTNLASLQISGKGKQAGVDQQKKLSTAEARIKSLETTVENQRTELKSLQISGKGKQAGGEHEKKLLTDEARIKSLEQKVENEIKKLVSLQLSNKNEQSALHCSVSTVHLMAERDQLKKELQASVAHIKLLEENICTRKSEIVLLRNVHSNTLQTLKTYESQLTSLQAQLRASEYLEPVDGLGNLNTVAARTAAAAAPDMIWFRDITIKEIFIICFFIIALYPPILQYVFG